MIKVLVHGCFDLIHPGHLSHFLAAKKWGSHLVVSVTADKWVNKGPGRPYFSAGQRAEMVRALGIVDEVVISDHPTAVEVIEQIKPDFYVKGNDYKDLTKDVTGEIYNEKAAVEKHGGQLVFTDEETFSSGTIINRFFQAWTDEQKTCIENIRALGGMGAIEKALEEIAKLRVLVVGEPILDVYRFVDPEGISSKSPTVSARFVREEEYQGGGFAIHSHLRDFCDSYFHNVTLFDAKTNYGYPKKIRYIAGTQRIFEVTHIQEKLWPHQEIAAGILNTKRDVIVAADFGHGMFDGPVMEAMNGAKGFVGLNVQTNSSNYGFNLYHKHKRWDYLCLDTRELRLGEHDKTSSPLDLANALWVRGRYDAHIGVTLGPNGAALFTSGHEIVSPAFADNIIDATGAGDAYFAITTCLLASGCRPELVPFIGNVFAGLKTKIIGNKSSVTKAQLLKACSGILK